MANPFGDNEQYLYFTILLYSITAFIIISIVVIELRSLYYVYNYENTPSLDSLPSINSQSKSQSRSNSTNSDPGTDKPPLLISSLPILCYLCYFISCIAALFTSSTIVNSTSCYIITLAAINTSYPLAKMIISFIFVYRLHIVYKNSLFQYKTQILFVMMVIIIFGWCVLFVLIELTSYVEIVHISGGKKLCRTHLMIEITGSMALLDLTTNGICCYLFIRPLLILAKNSQNVNGGKSVHSVYDIVLKYSILTIVIAISTLMAVIVAGLLGLNIVFMIDAAINCIAVMLFNKIYDYHFRCLCCGCIKICSKLMKQNRNENAPNDKISKQNTEINCSKDTTIDIK
eukprot:366077_1